MDAVLLRDARMVVREFVKVRHGEIVTLVTDARRQTEAEALAVAAGEAGGDVIVIDITAQIAQFLVSDDFWTPPPKSLVAAVQESNVSIFTVDETYAFRLDHKVRDTFRTGPDCSIYKIDLGMGEWGLTQKDIDLNREPGKRIQAAISGHDEVRVTTARGTDFTLSIKGRECLPVVAVPERGLPYGIPVPLWGEYNWAPIENSSNGMVVIDGITEATSKLHVVTEPVTLEVREGRVVQVSGGADADDFRRLIATDAGAAVIGELGVGGNPKAIRATETEKALLGTVHVGLGDNGDYPGGMNRSRVHVDGVIRNVTLEVDGLTILKAGRLLV